MKIFTTLTLTLGALLSAAKFSQAWVPSCEILPRRCEAVTNSRLSASSTNDETIEIVTNARQPDDILRAAEFMVDAFWIGSSRQLTTPVSFDDITDAARTKLVEQQVFDFTSKYGERMGQRMCDSLLLEAKDSETGSLLGVVGLEVTLLGNGDIISAETAEIMLKNAVASLGPKQRREYKNASVQQIATELLPPDVSAVCCLSNLAVSPAARRRGVALELCQQLECIVQQIGFEHLTLKVEKDNEAARRLYEEKLSYVQQHDQVSGGMALRANPTTGDFEEIAVDSIILTKPL
mmetsp:Transcript_7452/g.9683  ORF Transcript_7452/g.9683 Transcript_7452/m.9683 type:complete len:293 (+) Transcript_7452:118-996(+)|eukprot:CAMPEP_0198148216 /NCGR_PEP_ID=MMETSP1443-20131203/40443_1 /TAXON_ID=186043 /ORGANISM="Entomoneis sp., Strain CCMP2396" /LENGTH=292 /DNA_ID=CAMNT_0043812847 /DNA_START=85 /DNA_END=963 /DNA_ORIENTATION=+